MKPKEENVNQLILESFDIRDQSWRRKDPRNFHIEDKPFAEGAFRQAFKAYTSVGDEKWVVNTISTGGGGGGGGFRHAGEFIAITFVWLKIWR